MESDARARSGIGARLFALVALAASVSIVSCVGHTTYRAATDSFIAPIILSPDNDLVLGNKVKLAELDVERDKTLAEAAEVDADLAACATAIERLNELKGTVEGSLAWTRKVNARQTTAGAGDLKTLDAQRAALEKMLDKQKTAAKDAKANLQAGVVARADYEREVQSLRQLKLALLENERTRIQSDAQMQQAVLAERSLAGSRAAPMMPERMLQQDQAVRVELEILKLESEARAKRAEKKLDGEKLAKLDEVEKELKARPLFRAVDRKLDAAFVPYTQMEGVKAGADVYDCVWGLLACRSVGKVAEVVPGEVILPDPWGSQARGQYAILDLRDHEAARSKTLRVRPL